MIDIQVSRSKGNVKSQAYSLHDGEGTLLFYKLFFNLIYIHRNKTRTILTEFATNVSSLWILYQNPLTIHFRSDIYSIYNFST